LQLPISCYRGPILPSEYWMGAGADASAYAASRIPTTESPYRT